MRSSHPAPEFGYQVGRCGEPVRGYRNQLEVETAQSATNTVKLSRLSDRLYEVNGPERD